MDQINIILATYNGEAYIAQQLESILKSTYQEFVISIYDDGSTDRTIDIVREYQAMHPKRIQIHCNEQNQGHFRNFLQGLKNNPYPYVMFCDQDDVWNSNKIEVTYSYMRTLESKQATSIPVAVFTDATIVDEKLEQLHPSFHRSSKLDTTKLDFAHMLMENKMMGCTMMLNRTLIDFVQELPDYARYHDWWIGLVAAAFGTIGYLDQATMQYRQHGHNVVGNLSFRYYIANRIKNIRHQKQAIRDTVAQAKQFYQQYEQSLDTRDRRVLQQFSSLYEVSWLKRRWICIRYQCLKSGMLRNLGLMLFL